LLFVRPINANRYEANYSIRYERYEENEKKLIDSASTNFKELREVQKAYYIQQKIFIPKKEIGNIIYVSVKDFARNTNVTKRLVLGPKNALNKEDFLSFKESKINYSYPFLSVGSHLFKSETYLGDKMAFKYISAEGKLPPPIFSSKGISLPVFESDSTIEFQFTDSAEINFKKEGSYIPVSTYSQSFVIHVFDKGFPKIRTEKALLEPLRFICSKDEFAKLKNSENPRLAVELFWEERAKNRDKARALIKEFYTRAEHANKHFTTFTEGWKTDMGMIYLIFGEPRTVRKGGNSEYWYYGDERNAQTLTFKFYKRQNATFGQYYELNRMSMYKPIWMRAVDTWRSGRIYRAY
jgi:GWxTD domain-containing protein